MPADAIVQNYASGLPVDVIAEVFQLPAEGVRLLLAYAAEHEIVIDALNSTLQ